MPRFPLIMMAAAVSATASGCLTVSPGPRPVLTDLPEPRSVSPAPEGRPDLPRPTRPPLSAAPRPAAAAPVAPAPRAGLRTAPAAASAPRRAAAPRPSGIAAAAGREHGRPQPAADALPGPARGWEPGGSAMCALGRHYGGWAPGSDAYRICRSTYGR